MKVFLVSILVVLSSFSIDGSQCDQLTFDVLITNTTNGSDNGIITVANLKSSSKIRAFLYGDTKSKNRLDVKIDKLDHLESGTYYLVLQNKDCSSFKRDIIVK